MLSLSNRPIAFLLPACLFVFGPTNAGAQTPIMSMDVCPITYGSFPMDGPALSCSCPAEAAKADASVWGANPYSSESSICRAAVNAGAIGLTGGQVMVTPQPNVPLFPGVNRNGVRTSNDRGGEGFRIEVTTEAQKPAVHRTDQPVQAPIAETLKAVGNVQVYVSFATASDRIEPSSSPVLSELLATLRNDPKLRVELIGHTDSQGTAPYNLDLSQRRAAAVYGWLVQRGADRARLGSSGRGLLEPIADNATEQGRALNRRVEVRALDRGPVPVSSAKP
jgi:outer membrane protein OmpA-like peptidoglycan-associated protein